MMTLEKAHAILLHAYGVHTKNGKVKAIATSDLPYGEINEVFEAWQVIENRVRKEG